MKNICLIFLVNQPLFLRPYRFFEIGEHNPYVDEQATAELVTNSARFGYLPANHLLLRQIYSNKDKIKVAFYLSGITAELLEKYAPETYDSFRELAATGCVEFLTGTYSWSLSSMWDSAAFHRQTEDHRKCMERLTGKKPSGVFLNTDLLYDNQLGTILTEMGMEGIITEGDRQLLGWKSPDSLYSDALIPSLKLFFRNPSLSDEFIHQFTQSKPDASPLTPQKYLDSLLPGDATGNLVNLVIPYDVFNHQRSTSPGIMHFMDHFLHLATRFSGIQLSLPSEILQLQSEANAIQVHRTLAMEAGNSFFRNDQDNDLQVEALSQLYDLTGKAEKVSDADAWQEWNVLQYSGHFRNMSTLPLSPGHQDAENPYTSPFEAFIHYMNILNDFKIKLKRLDKK